MLLKSVKIMLRVVGGFVSLFGLYLIFFEKKVIGIFAIIIGFIILPSVEDKKNSKMRKFDKRLDNDINGSVKSERSSHAAESDSGSD